MGEQRQFRLPDVGEGLTEAVVVAWRVEPGDVVAVDQVVVEVETAKALVELPSPMEGTVVEVLHGEGTTVDVGAPLLTVDVGGDPLLVGYGVKESRPVRRRRKAVVDEERVHATGVRARTAAAMVKSAFTAPHVTTWLQVDVTPTMELVRELRERPEFADVRVSPLLLVARAVVRAVADHREVNASWDDDTGEIVLKRPVHLGVGVATDRGLLVPNVKDAHTLSLPELARALSDLVGRAREGTTEPHELVGGTLTISNPGIFGTDAGTPILVPGETVILALGRIAERPWAHEGRLALRQVVTLALSFDHRVIDGELASRFLSAVGSDLESPSDLG
ncbi:dihydrolipoamide acetyltransferase family protein [Actinosynnema sp. NPDC047251]|uniref:Dihydrolipoamide acetyltransferase component of pyruvate dehydrogenase complex n=1 Tax=Saccharothrix espanaensis (strain ATCC 51144 / DSM 44229 / JCM 9112 / NBRC 15066 / NRRL 15764) TaxID=1179773 RepID=K0K3U2_SACES|nr:dihydrolipoamide acetyltransferase family protein [Saccharothrix espanaensis]CCH31203.1 Branched-chain alpha keto acid dehydrogenase, E2 subunit [Saccharothrix espanaensis DSM 44229]